MREEIKAEAPEFVQQEVLDVWNMARSWLTSEELTYRFG